MSDLWDPAEVRQRFGLSLTEQQKTSVIEKLAPDPDNDGFAADGVFEGGGVLGIAFLGAARCCHELGIRWKNLAGTSAGAITAALLASRLDIGDIERAVGSLDLTSLVGRKTSRLLLDWNPSDDLDHPVWLFLKLLFARRAGQYSTRPFEEWLERVLAEGNVGGFGSLIAGSTDIAGSASRLKVVVSDITHGRMLVLPDDLDHSVRNDFSVAEAVRLSMSIPLFFEPGSLSPESLRSYEDGSRPTSAAVVVDGGILSNFPVWIFDAVAGRRPRWPTFGFRLVNRDCDTPLAIRGPLGLAIAMFQTMRTAHDRRISAEKRARTIDIDLTAAIRRHGIAVTSFKLSNDAKNDLYVTGYECARDFFLNHWSWKEHLLSRGFTVDTATPSDGTPP